MINQNHKCFRELSESASFQSQADTKTKNTSRYATNPIINRIANINIHFKEIQTNFLC